MGDLILVCIAITPGPFATVREALAQILLVTPEDLLGQVETVASQVVEQHGFLSHRAFVARVGRGTQIELAFIVPEHWHEGWENGICCVTRSARPSAKTVPIDG